MPDSDGSEHDRHASPALLRETGWHMASGTAPNVNDRIIDEFELKVRQRMKDEGLSTMPRGAHPHHHGIVSAELRVRR